MNGVARVVADVPASLKKRALAVAKKRAGTISELVRDSLTREVEFFEQKYKEEEDALRGSKNNSPTKGLKGLGPRAPVDTSVAEPDDRLAPIFENHAQRIMEVFNQPHLVAIRRDEAFAAIRRLAPLTYLDENKIRMRLEGLIAAKADMEGPVETVAPNTVAPVPVPPSPMENLATLMDIMRRQIPPAASPQDDLVGRSIDPSRVRTRGVVQDDE